MDRVAAIAAIQALFASYRTAQPGDLALLQALTDGKLYELFVLSELVDDLANRGLTLTFVGTTLKFKGSPGMIKPGDSHFDVTSPGSPFPDHHIYVDIEFDTLGHSNVGASDYSRRHEIDIVVTSASSGYPAHDQIALGVECKAHANFAKNLIKEALGVRRELSLLRMPLDSVLTSAGGNPGVQVNADPPSEFWLAFTDPNGTNYADSPAAFSIELRHLEP